MESHDPRALGHLCMESVYDYSLFIFFNEHIKQFVRWGVVLYLSSLLEPGVIVSYNLTVQTH